MKVLKTISLTVLFGSAVFGQTGSINNTLGSGGTFTVKNSSSSPLVVVDEATGQLTADRVKVDGVPSFLAAHVDEINLDNAPYVLTAWNETPSASAMGLHDNSSSFNPATGEFVAPRDGFYFVSAYIELSGIGNSGSAIYVLIDSQLSGMRSASSIFENVSYINVSGIIKLLANQVVTVSITKPGSGGSCTAGQGYFSGYLVSDF